jgi:hypothetical protein
VIVCAACGRESPNDAAFCAGCGAALAGYEQALLEERKVVTILFADLVGSTARAEHQDPEDVRAALSAYYGRVRNELERHGGTVARRRTCGGSRRSFPPAPEPLDQSSASRRSRNRRSAFEWTSSSARSYAERASSRRSSRRRSSARVACR